MKENLTQNFRERRANRPGVSAIILVLAIVLAVAVPLFGESPWVGIAVFSATITVLAGLYDPFLLLAVILVQLSFIPSEGYFVGRLMPNLMQFLVPMLILIAYARALKDADHKRLTPSRLDICIVLLGLWGLTATYLVDANLKWYSNKVLLPMLMYFGVRLVPLSRHRMQLLLMLVMAGVIVQGALSIRESSVGSSPFYQVSSENIYGVKPSQGPFEANWTAAAYYIVWAPLLIYASSLRPERWWKAGWVLGVFVVLLVVTRTMERVSLLGALIGILVCLGSSRLRRTTLAIIGLLLAAAIPWAAQGAGAALMDRFRETDQSRTAYWTSALNYLTSGDWNPLTGTGYMQFKYFAGEYGTGERVILHGYKETTIAEGAQGSSIHSLWLSLPIDFGAPEAILFAATMLALARAFLRIRREAPTGYRLDGGLLISVAGGMLALACVATFHNLHTMAPPSTVFWVLCGLLTHPEAFYERLAIPQASTA